MSGSCLDQGALRTPDCGARDALPLCAPLRSATNLSTESIRIEGWFPELNAWTPLVPRVAPTSAATTLSRGALWLPRNVVLRSVRHVDGELLTVFGAIGNGAQLVQTSESA